MALQVYYLLLNHLVLVSFLNSYCFCKQLVALDLEKDRLERWSAPHEKVGQPTIVNVDSLHTILAILKSSSFPTAVGNISNQQCVEDSLLYVHSLYNVTAGARWARQSTFPSIIYHDKLFINHALLLQCTNRQPDCLSACLDREMFTQTDFSTSVSLSANQRTSASKANTVLYFFPQLR